MTRSDIRPITSQPVTTTAFKGIQHKQSFKKPFSAHLHSAIAETAKLTVSKHAKERMMQRNIHIGDERWKVIEEKVLEAGRMGIKESLVLLSDAAMIVNAKNKTVITVMGREEANTQIFTNINGTILLDK